MLKQLLVSTTVLALAGTKLNILLLESGGENFESRIQKMYSGSLGGDPYIALDAGRLRVLGGGTNHWGGWCRPMDAIEFETRDWIPHSGWPFEKACFSRLCVCGR